MISRATILFTTSIFLLVFVARPLLTLILSFGSRAMLGSSLVIALVFVGTWGILSLIRRGARAGALLFVVITVLASWYAASLPIVEERIHIFIFGVLGYLLTRDLQGSIARPRLIATALCAYVATLDECVQWFHPARVGDPHDVFVGTIGGLLGTLLARAGLLSTKPDIPTPR